MAEKVFNLESGHVVKARTMSEQEYMNVALAFSEEVLEAIESRMDNVDPALGIQIYRENISYTLYLLEQAVTLESDMPGKSWLKKLARYSQIHGLDKDSLDDPDYIEAVFIYKIAATQEELQEISAFVMTQEPESGKKVSGKNAKSNKEESEE